MQPQRQRHSVDEVAPMPNLPHPAARATSRSCSARPAAFAPDANTGGDRDHHGRLRYNEHCGIDVLRQFVDRADTAPAIDFARPAADQMDFAAIAAAIEIGEHGAADRIRLRRGADNRHGARAHQPIEPCWSLR
jgi:hypothetical protein